jgi:hypothetical protein
MSRSRPRALSRKLIAVGAALLVAGWCAVATAAPSASAATTSVTVNGTQGGRTFDGIGAISGGGGNSRLLSDYPAAQQQQVYDYLFKPGYGADLQILKVEIGGDTNSTDGSESSIEHASGSVDCNAGYEWALMQAAKARNPGIKLYALAWGAPGWIGGGSGAAAMARADNRDYIDGKMTATINWPVAAALYPSFPYSTDGLILANQPWSGWYSAGKQLWVTAQTTQFTAPGWTYIDSASGYLGGSGSNGSYVTLKSPDGTDWSSIIETTQATAAQTVNYTVTGGLSTGTVHVWSTNVNSSDPSTWFVHSQDVTPAGGSFSLTLQPGYVYSLTTTSGQGKGAAASPAQGSLSLPYSDNFDSDPLGQQPPYLSQLQGAFEVAPCAGGRSGQCVQPRAPVQPIEWDSNASPFTIGGNPGWSNYTVSADALIEQAGAVQLIGRAGSQVGYYPPAADEYYLQLSSAGAWQVDRREHRPDHGGGQRFSVRGR